MAVINKQPDYLKLKYLIKKIRKKIRRCVVARRHRRIAQVWQPMISDYFKGTIKKNSLQPKQQINGKIIWQYWGQEDGAELPAVVQICFDSVDRYKKDYQVIRLNDKTVRDYIDFPEFIWKKEGGYKFSRVFFSDLLRLALLHVYGGVWVDATILLTAPLPEEFNDQDYFVFQRSEAEPNKFFWSGSDSSYWSWDPMYRIKMLNSIIFAKKNSVMITTMFNLLLHYWKTQHKIINYFFFHVLYNELINGRLKEYQCKEVSDTLPHIMRVLMDGHNYMSLSELLDTISIHKLTYFNEEQMAKLNELLKQIEQINRHK